MPKPSAVAGAMLILACSLSEAANAACTSSPVFFSGPLSETEGAITVNAGTACRFNPNGIPGAVREVKILQAPKVGRAKVENLSVYYAAKPGYSGPDEFAYAYIGTDQYGGPMNVVVRRKATVVP
ncbi:hypothetical protein [Microvirga pudoricolor]|uniref:hypothetical protein n=1 Tax=Microvirga pudoricolor TaxID=2778729 RepID=UPI00194EE31B|nr:hypothetical protein [Microvirga pudoricolor]MBM6593392.1 hypothetical protein [Microvirga pudoricolor]